MTCDDARIDLGGYVLGGLEPAERIAVDEHLAHCAECRSELSELAELPALLGRLSEAEAEHGLQVDPPSDLLDKLLSEVSTERRRTRGRVLLAVAASLLVAVLGAGVTTAAVTGSHDTAARTTTVTAAGISATAGLRPDAKRTAVDLSISGVQAGQRCRLLVVDTSGKEQVLSEWQVDYDGSAHVQAVAQVPSQRLAALRVVTVEGQDLARLPAPGTG